MSDRPRDRAVDFGRAPVALAVLDRATGRIVEVNRAFLSLTGRSREELLAMPFASLWSVAGRIFQETHLIPMLDLQGHVEEVAMEVVAADGSRVPVLVSATTDDSDDSDDSDAAAPGGDLVRVALFPARDRRRYEADLLAATRAAQEASERAVALAQTLQQTLIPPVPPVIPRLEVTAAYRPAGAGDEVGGDFYDVFNVAPGVWTVVLGDVVGKGVPAASVTAYLRHAVRDLAMQHDDPAELLHALDAGLRAHPTDKFCTVVVLRIVDAAAGWRVTGAAGGHPLPLLGRRDGTLEELGVPGSLIGILEAPRFTTFTHDLADDEFVTLYTDGVTEARRGRSLYGDRALHHLVSRLAATPERVTDAVVEAAIAFQDGCPYDDIAVLTFHPTTPAGDVSATPGGRVRH